MCNSSDKSSCLGSTDYTFTGYTILRLLSYTTETGAASSGEKRAVKLEKNQSCARYFYCFNNFSKL